jgi:hypothetical protein
VRSCLSAGSDPPRLHDRTAKRASRRVYLRHRALRQPSVARGCGKAEENHSRPAKPFRIDKLAKVRVFGEQLLVGRRARVSEPSGRRCEEDPRPRQAYRGQPIEEPAPQRSQSLRRQRIAPSTISRWFEAAVRLSLRARSYRPIKRSPRGCRRVSPGDRHEAGRPRSSLPPVCGRSARDLDERALMTALPIITYVLISIRSAFGFSPRPRASSSETICSTVLRTRPPL